MGGEKTVTQKIPHYIWPEISLSAKKAVFEQLTTAVSIYDKSGIYKEFEDNFAQYHDIPYALSISSGTMALYSIFVGANLQPGDEIICPAYTFFATISPIFFTGAIPVLCDADETGNINPNLIEKLITPKTKAIIVTHMWGIPCDMDAITAIAKKHNLLLFEDCSHAHGARYKGKLVGTFGDAAAWSLQGQKIITAGEGGIILTRNKEIYYRAMLLGHFNKRSMKETDPKHPLYKYAVTGFGLKLRIHPLGAALANQQFQNLDIWLKEKRKYAELFDKELKKLPGITIPSRPKDTHPAWYGYVFHYEPNAQISASIDEIYASLQAESCTVLDRPNSTCPLNLHPLFQDPGTVFKDYAGKVHYKPGDFPVAEKFHRTSLKLPTWHHPKYRTIAHQYLEAFKKVFNHYKK